MVIAGPELNGRAVITYGNHWTFKVGCSASRNTRSRRSHLRAMPEPPAARAPRASPCLEARADAEPVHFGGRDRADAAEGAGFQVSTNAGSYSGRITNSTSACAGRTRAWRGTRHRTPRPRRSGRSARKCRPGAAQGWIVALLPGSVEGIHVDVDDPALTLLRLGWQLWSRDGRVFNTGERSSAQDGAAHGFPFPLALVPGVASWPALAYPGRHVWSLRPVHHAS